MQLQSTPTSLVRPHSARIRCVAYRCNVHARLLRASPRSTQFSTHSRRHALFRVCAQSQEKQPDEDKSSTNEFALAAPSTPTSAVGTMAAYYLQMQPHLFRETVETQLQKIKDEREANKNKQAPESSDGKDLVLYKRMEEVRRAEEVVAVEDLMYVCILEKFKELGVDMLPRVEPIDENIETLKALTEGVHSREALQMVKEHVLSTLGPAAMTYANQMIKMSKLQAAQVYLASIMFGYFLRRVDSRFQLAKTLGMLPESKEDAVERLNRLFTMADEMELSDDPDSAPIPDPLDDASASSSSQTAVPPTDGNSGFNAIAQKKRGGAIRDYIESFDQELLVETARLVTREGQGLVERQSSALFGDIQALQAEMQQVVGQDAGSMEEIMQRVQQAVSNDNVAVVAMTVGTQRRAVLEAIAYGCFLRDVETWVEADYGLLTPVSGGL